MSKTAHRIYISVMVLIVIITTVFLSYKGYSYYSTPMEERFYHPDHENFKAAGDPVPFPPFVYYSAGILSLIGLLAFWKDRKYKRYQQY